MYLPFCINDLPNYLPFYINDLPNVSSFLTRCPMQMFLSTDNLIDRTNNEVEQFRLDNFRLSLSNINENVALLFTNRDYALNNNKFQINDTILNFLNSHKFLSLTFGKKFINLIKTYVLTGW